MTRPYKDHTATELERLIREGTVVSDLPGLKAVRDELRQRSTKKAGELLEKVVDLITRAQVEAKGKPSVQGQMELPVSDEPPLLIPVLGAVSVADVKAKPPSTADSPVKTKPPLPAALLAKASFPGPGPSAQLPPMGAQEAAKLLGVALSARWDAVEAARAALVRAAVFSSVEGAQPDLEGARRANTAYAALAASRRY